MSDKKKKFVPFKEAATRRTLILKSERDTTGETERVKIEKPIEKEKQPTILLKPREPSTPKDENRSQSPKLQQNTDAESSVPSKIAHNEHKEKKIIEQRSCAPIPPMLKTVKLLDDKFELNPAAGDFLHDSNSNYLVVGILGFQGVGKSTILNILANDNPLDDMCSRMVTLREVCASHYEDDQTPIEQMESLNFVNNSEENDDNTADQYFKFKMQGIEHIEHAQHCTKGIDMYVTTGRVILLDSQAVLSPSALEEGSMTGATPVTVRGSTVNTVDCLQVASYLMAVCHVLIVTQDWFTDYNFLRFIQTAEMLKPSVWGGSGESEASEGSSGGTGGETPPHLLLMHNRCTLEHFRPDSVLTMQKLYRKVFQNSKMQLNSGMYLYGDENWNGASVDAVSAAYSVSSCGPPINMFLLPEIYDYCENTEMYRGHPTFAEMASRLRWTVFGANRHQITNVASLSEKGWFHYCGKAWETIRKSTFFMEYGRLLP